MAINDVEIIEGVISNPGVHFQPKIMPAADVPRELGREIAGRFPAIWGRHEHPDKINWLHTFRNEYIDMACRLNAVVTDHREKSLALASLEVAYDRTVRAILA